MTRRSFLAASAVAPLAAQASATFRFRKGVCNPMIPGPDDLAERFRLASRAGFSGIELRLGDRPTEVSPRLGSEELQRLREAADQSKVEIVSLWATTSSSGGSLFSPLAEERERFASSIRTAIESAAMLGCGAVLLNLGSIGRGPELLYGYGEAWKRSVEEFAKLLPLAAEKKVMLTPENVWNKFLMSPLEMRRYLREIDSRWMQAHFDTANVMPWGYAEDWIRTLGPLIQRVHLKDFRLGDRMNEGDFVPLLSGDVNFPAVMQAFDEVGYSGFLCPEGPREKDFDALLDLSKRLDQIIEMA